MDKKNALLDQLLNEIQGGTAAALLSRDALASLKNAESLAEVKSILSASQISLSDPDLECLLNSVQNRHCNRVTEK